MGKRPDTNRWEVDTKEGDKLSIEKTSPCDAATQAREYGYTPTSVKREG